MHSEAQAIARIVERSFTQTGENLVELCSKSAVLLVFLRHAGCTFCRETLSDLGKIREELERDGIRVVLVHMGGTDSILELLIQYGLTDLERIHDAEQDLYRAFGLKRGKFAQLFGFKVLTRSLFGGALLRYGIGRMDGDPMQMPGVFLIRDNQIVRRFRHQSAADRPDYGALLKLPAES